jgi:plasmid stability protein
VVSLMWSGGTRPRLPTEPSDADLGAALRVRLAQTTHAIAAKEREIITERRRTDIDEARRHDNLRALQRERTRLQDDAIALGSVIDLARRRLEGTEG